MQRQLAGKPPNSSLVKAPRRGVPHCSCPQKRCTPQGQFCHSSWELCALSPPSFERSSCVQHELCGSIFPLDTIGALSCACTGGSAENLEYAVQWIVPATAYGAPQSRRVSRFQSTVQCLVEAQCEEHVLLYVTALPWRMRVEVRAGSGPCCVKQGRRADRSLGDSPNVKMHRYAV
ncbi:hypothetical protein AAFF_G00214910 [Aldrovandia affinis]|uniref:Uncharacterized protein n=1 Tax=Aldrovandia affinis TaxID=143900 RepID=A0AAD7W5P1_9TELE|nr:hypothetical protein AAFF_G00214910 [Aldrovandia affinis]